MKKCGAKPILDTYVQLAFGVATMQSSQPNNVCQRQILNIMERLEPIKNWFEHKNIGIIMTILKNAAVRTEETAFAVAAANILWTNSNPFSHETKMTDNEVEKYLTHYLLIMEISPHRR